MGEVKAEDLAERLEELATRRRRVVDVMTSATDGIAQSLVVSAADEASLAAEAASLLRSQAEEIARLREAVEPFAADFDWIDEPTRCPDEASVCADDYSRPITYADIRRARAAINRSGEP